MAYTTTCWSWEVRANMPMEGSYSRDVFEPEAQAWIRGALEVRMFACPECDMPTVVSATATDDGRRRISEVVTGVAAGTRLADVPGQIASTAAEAQRCHAVGAHRGAVVLARAVLEATCKDKGVVSGQLAQKIASMYTKGLIHELVRDEATELRHAGNAVAHADDVEVVSGEESAQYLTLMGHLLADVYQRPAEVARLRDAREAARASSAASKTPE